MNDGGLLPAALTFYHLMKKKTKMLCESTENDYDNTKKKNRKKENKLNWWVQHFLIPLLFPLLLLCICIVVGNEKKKLQNT